MTAPGSGIAERLQDIRDRIARAAARAGRDPSSVSLLAVSKGQPVGRVREAAAAGQQIFGENRVQEGIGKIEALQGELPQVVWKLIGPLQTNKAKAALQYFSTVESLDRERLALRLESLLAETGRTLPVLLEINLASEATKSGVLTNEAENLAAACLALPHLDVRGLMAVPPYAEDPDASRPHFRRLRETRDRLAERFGREMPELSMGMSHDFEVAVEEGSTEVRIGTALFGARETA
ncbi:MAG: YggS family pyridoxal phosphate-dependent enzyme [Thermoanaerobaculia bacterium]